MATRLHWRKHYCGDFLGRVSRWPLDAVGCYAVMLDLFYLNGPMSDFELDANLGSLSKHGQSLIRAVLTRTDRGWTHPRVEQDREAAEDRSKKAQESSYARWSRNSDDANAMRTHSERSALAFRTECGTVDVDDVVVASDSSLKGDARGNRGLSWTPSGGFVGITESDREGWALAYPAVDLARQIPAMHEWLLSNPRKAVKSNWRKFVTGWLSRQQDRGGDTPTARPPSRPAKETIEERSSRLRREADADLARIGWQPPVGAGAKGQSGPQTHTNNGTQQRAS